jgi:hypothetical protein
MNIKEVIASVFKDRVGVLATMHQKEEVMAPILEKELGVKLVVPQGFNSDEFGTFTGDIERRGNQLEAARHKAHAAMKLANTTLAFASEGTFGPHPLIPFVPYNHELVMLVDQEHDLEICGMAATTETNYSHKVVKDFHEALEFSRSAGFPAHGLIVKLTKFSSDQTEMIKGISNEQQLLKAVEFARQRSVDGNAYIETDMRAQYNPMRMKNIESATQDLIKNVSLLCPKCSWPGFKFIGRKQGLPCSGCGFTTELTLAHTYQCQKCRYHEEKLYPNGAEQADPGSCQICNP